MRQFGHWILVLVFASPAIGAERVKAVDGELLAEAVAGQPYQTLVEIPQPGITASVYAVRGASPASPPFLPASRTVSATRC